MTVNNAQKSKGRVNISNIPTFNDIDSDHKNDMQLFDNNVRSFSAPEKSLTSIKTTYQNGEMIHLDPSGNKDWYTFSIEFVVDENYINYMTFCYWWKRIKSGVPTSELYKDFTINEVNLWFLDNQKRDRFCEKLRNVFLTNISGLSTEYGDESDQIFTASFTAQHMDFIGVMKDSKVIDTLEEFDSN